MKKMFCDRCGREIVPMYTHTISFDDELGFKGMPPSVDLCEECGQRLVDFMGKKFKERVLLKRVHR